MCKLLCHYFLFPNSSLEATASKMKYAAGAWKRVVDLQQGTRRSFDQSKSWFGRKPKKIVITTETNGAK